MGYIVGKRASNKSMHRYGGHEAATDQFLKKIHGHIPPSNLRRFAGTPDCKIIDGWFTLYPLHIPNNELKEWRKYNGKEFNDIPITMKLFLWFKIKYSPRLYKEAKEKLFNYFINYIKKSRYTPDKMQRTKYANNGLHEIDTAINDVHINEDKIIAIKKECLNRFIRSLSLCEEVALQNFLSNK